MDTFAKLMGVGLVVLAFLAVWALLIGLPTMWLWNWLMPVIFGLPLSASGSRLVLCSSLASSSSPPRRPRASNV